MTREAEVRSNGKPTDGKALSTTFALLGRGAALGAATGGVLASIYAAMAPLAFSALLALTNSANGRAGDALIGAAVFGICSGPFAFVLGILPGVLLGAASGLLIGLLVAPFRRTLPRWAAALIGLLVAAAIAVAGNLLLGPDMIEPHRPAPGRYFPYVFWILGPSLLVLIGLPWVGWMLRTDWTAAIRAESRSWQARCSQCGAEHSVWERSGIRWKAQGTPRRLIACPQCSRPTWHTLGRKDEGLAEEDGLQ